MATISTEFTHNTTLYGLSFKWPDHIVSLYCVFPGQREQQLQQLRLYQEQRWGSWWSTVSLGTPPMYLRLLYLALFDLLYVHAAGRLHVLGGCADHERC